LQNFTAKENAFEEFKKLRLKFKSTKNSIHTANEAKTRLLIIDNVLGLLGWPDESFNPETRTSSNGYVDYLLKYENIARFVIEAKKIGGTFSSPMKKPQQNEYSISYLKSAFKTLLTETIKQATMYCYDCGVSFAVITNGAEWMVLQLVPKPGKNLDNMKGFYFGNIFNDNFYFDQFYELLSKDNVNSGYLESCLSDINYTPSPVCKIIKSDYGTPIWNSYHKEQYIDEFYKEFFGDMINGNQRKMLEQCFVSDSKLDQYSGDLKRILKDTSPVFLPNSAEDLTPGESKESIVNEMDAGRVIIITGSVGCGKTTLVRKALLETKQVKSETTFPILVDLINDVSKSEKNAKRVIYKKINETLLNNFEEIRHLPNLRKIFKNELSALRNGPRKEQFDRTEELYADKEAELLEHLTSDDENFVTRSLKLITSENKSVILIVDNVDRASENFQEEMYTIAHSLSSASRATVIITMREFTFFKNKDKGWLDVRGTEKIIHLKAPDFSKLIAKRLNYIENYFDDDFRVREWRKNLNLEDFRKVSQEYAAVIKTSLQSGTEGLKVLETLSCISWHNIRLFNELLKQVHTQLGTKHSRWQYDEVLAALMVGREEGQTAVIPNMFNPYQDVNQCYFLKFRLLLFMSYSMKNNEITHGVPLRRIVGFAQMYGYRANWINSSIEECVRQRLIECLDIPSDSDELLEFELKEGQVFRASPLGTILINEIASKPIYLAIISSDLTFHSENDFTNLQKVYGEVFSLMGNRGKNEIVKEGIDIISSSDIPILLSRYLVGRYNSEKIPNDSYRSISEIRHTEDKVTQFINQISGPKLPAKSSVKINPMQITFDLGETKNSPEGLNSEDSFENSQLIKELIPKHIESLTFDNSEYIPLIICALVIRRFQGFENSQGVEITKTINDYIAKEGNKKESTNVSRALRSNNLRGQKWLRLRKDVYPKFDAFSLHENWKEHWESIFNEEPIL
jgi:Cdc6-like AAA superfamily ATPase